MAPDRPKIVLPGGSGFLGKVLAQWFTECGSDVVILTRRGKRETDGPEVSRLRLPNDREHNGAASIRTVSWDGRTVGKWARELEGTEAIINLAGKSVNCRYTARNRREILASRVDSTRALGEAIVRCANPPRVWLNSSTATIYKHSFDRPMDDATGVIGATPEAKDAFSIEVAQAWEAAFNRCETPATRKIALRTAMVFSREPGTVYPILARLVRLGLGGPMAGGRQFVSWIHELDFCRAIEFLIAREDLTGVFNVAAPTPVPNAALMGQLRRSLGIPLGLPAPRLLLELGSFFLRTETELVIKSRRVVPGRLLEARFEFLYPEVEGAVEELRGGTARMRDAAST